MASIVCKGADSAGSLTEPLAPWHLFVSSHESYFFAFALSRNIASDDLLRKCNVRLYVYADRVISQMK
jgi:hypothetical protein